MVYLCLSYAGIFIHNGLFLKTQKGDGYSDSKVFGTLCDISDLILSGIHLCNRNKSGFGSMDSEVFPLVSVVCFRIQGYNTICYEDSLPRCNGHHRCLGSCHRFLALCRQPAVNSKDSILLSILSDRSLSKYGHRSQIEAQGGGELYRRYL